MTKFKVGDIVRCINVPGYPGRRAEVHGGGWEFGKEFKIAKITNQNGREAGNSLDMPIYWYKGNSIQDSRGVYEHALQKEIKVYGIVTFLEKINATKV